MKEKDIFQSLRKQKIPFSLNTRMTLLVVAAFLVSLAVAFGLVSLFNYLFPVLEKEAFFWIIAVLSVIIAAVATRLLSRLFFDPINALREGMQRVADGDFQVEMTPPKFAAKEIKEVYAGFNLMVRELRSTEILQTDFVSNVSHEFKTPINAIEGYSTLLQGESLTGDAEEYVEKIFFNTTRLSTLVSNILLLSKIENQSIPTHQSRYTLDEQIRESIVALEMAWETKNIEWDVELVPVFYYGNENMMYHVWTNVIGNAVKFSPPGGRVTVRLGCENGNATVTVADQGPGLSPEGEKHLFDKFYQQDSSHKQEGNGLGLALVKRILTLEKGHILAGNGPEGGCRISVTLPLDKGDTIAVFPEDY